MSILHVYSGGLDSTVLLYHLRERVGACVNFSYGSRHNARERESAWNFCKRLEIPLMEIMLPMESFRSALLQGGAAVPDGPYDDENMKQTVVPFRNGIMLAYAAGLAESLGMTHVSIAAHAGDHQIYPDCRSVFLAAMEEAIALGTWANIRLLAPFQKMSKKDIVCEGARLEVPMHLTWTCYKGGEKHCGVCGACDERRKAFTEAGIMDKTGYEI